MSKPSQYDVFDFGGPHYLNDVKWEIAEHKRSVAASLVQGVYITEFDRQQKREENNLLAPTWWEFFHFKCIETLVDKNDSSIFGAIFEHKDAIPYHLNSTLSPPRYVIALRGTIIKRKTVIQDFYLDAKIFIHELKHSSRYKIALDKIEGLLQNVTDPIHFWLTGHSLGAALTLQLGKDMAKRGCYIETYLFNPPHSSASIEILKGRKLKHAARVTQSVASAGLSYALMKIKNSIDSSTTDEDYCDDDTFTTLGPWIPYVFVNPRDAICSEYIGYFEHREKMEQWGAGVIERIATKNTVVNLLKNATGMGGDEALHLIPSAFVTKNMKNMIVKENGLLLAHGLRQWWEQHSFWQSKLYQYNKGCIFTQDPQL